MADTDTAKSPFRTGRFTRIQDSISQTRRMPRLGKIRLGIKLMSPKNQKEYPKETDYFVVPQEVAAVYGPEPKELDVMFPVNDPDIIFPQQLEWYGSSAGLKCHGDKVAASRRQPDGTWQDMACPCPNLKTDDNPKGECTERGHLLVLLPKVSMGGIYQIDTGSYHSIVDVNSGIDMVRSLLHGRMAMVPLKLRRVPRQTHNDMTKRIHYTLMLTLDANVTEINRLIEDSKYIVDRTKNLQLEAPVLEASSAGAPDALATAADEHEDVEDAQVVSGPSAAMPPPPEQVQLDPGPGPNFDLLAKYRDDIRDAKHVREASEVGNEIEDDPHLLPSQRQGLRLAIKERITELSKKRK